MLIIVDGPDCSRKSTLTRLLARYLHGRSDADALDIIHRGPPSTHPLDEYVTPLLDYRPNVGRHVICDRWHLGELVYPGVIGRPTHLDDAVFRYVELFLQSRGAVLVVITPDEDELRDCLTRRGDDPIELTRVSAIREGFLTAATRSSLPLIWLKDETVDADLISPIVEAGDSHAHDATELLRFTTYVGPRWPRLLLVGDVRATGATPGDLRPAFMPYGATSGHYLLTALDPQPLGVGIMNACDVDEVDLAHVTLGRPTTVALGRNAQRVAAWADRRAPHPQWARRFRYHERELYRSQLLGT